MWQVTARCLCWASSRGWQRLLPRSGPGPGPSPAPAAPQHRSPARTPGTASARGLSSMVPSVRLSPATRSLFDEPLAIAVQGLGPRQQVTLRTSLRDETGELFQACARYQAGDDGELDLARCPALPGGSFSGPEPMGLLWALQPQKPFRRLVKRDVQSPFLLQLEVFEGHGDPSGRLLAQAQHERAFLRDGVRRVPVREGMIRATLFLPPGNGPFPGIIDLYGTGGGLPEYRACLLANHGFAVLALAFYGYEDLPKEMKEFHLEYFEEAVNYMLQHSQAKATTIKEALAKWEEKNGQKASEAKEVKLYGQIPPVERMDESLSTLVNCEKLSLSTNCIERIANLNSLKNLRILSLGRNNIKNLNGLEAVADTLEELWISYNFIEKLRGIRVMKKLKVLYMSNNLVKDWAEFVRLAELPLLEDLVFVGNPLQEKYASDQKNNWIEEATKRVPKLKKLDGILVIKQEEDEEGAN
ncbi:uncharacterized protein J5F26_005822 isoform 2-T3 [Ciconia maguari]